jgi:hypothetical protein
MTAPAVPSDDGEENASEFTVARSDRDAWGTIRGYQVDLTIDRWLSLRDSEALELERGEDIDVVASGLEPDDRGILQQIKHRDTCMTLRSPAVRSFLATAYAAVANLGGARR